MFLQSIVVYKVSITYEIVNLNKLLMKDFEEKALATSSGLVCRNPRLEYRRMHGSTRTFQALS